MWRWKLPNEMTISTFIYSIGQKLFMKKDGSKECVGIGSTRCSAVVKSSSTDYTSDIPFCSIFFNSFEDNTSATVTTAYRRTCTTKSVTSTSRNALLYNTNIQNTEKWIYSERTINFDMSKLRSVLAFIQEAGTEFVRSYIFSKLFRYPLYTLVVFHHWYFCYLQDGRCRSNISWLGHPPTDHLINRVKKVLQSRCYGKIHMYSNWYLNCIIYCILFKKP